MQVSITKEQFTSDIVGSKGSKDSLAELLGSKVSRERFFKAVDGAKDLTKDEKAKAFADSRLSGLLNEEQYIIAQPSEAATQNRAQTKLRDQLRERLARKLASKEESKAEEEQPPIKDGVLGENLFGEETLQPSEEFFQENGMEEQEEEPGLTLFDVVHRKYREKHGMMSPD